jgi:hypothetical protein
MVFAMTVSLQTDIIGLRRLDAVGAVWIALGEVAGAVMRCAKVGQRWLANTQLVSLHQRAQIAKSMPPTRKVQTSKTLRPCGLPPRASDLGQALPVETSAASHRRRRQTSSVAELHFGPRDFFAGRPDCLVAEVKPKLASCSWALMELV